jgi:hypothetical protein
MTTFDAAWADRERAERARLAERGLYDPALEHDACGVGLVVSIDGKPSRQVVENGIEALKAVWHRGAVDADGKTGDGAGIHVQIPVPFFYDQIRRTGHEPEPRAADRGRPGVPAAQRFRRAGNLPDHRRGRSPADGLFDLWLAPCAGRHFGAGRKGQRHPARDRTDHHLQRQGCRRGDLRARALRDPPPDRESRGRRADPRALPVFAELPVDHLQGHDAGRTGRRILSRSAGRPVRKRLCDLSPALFHQHLPAMVAGPAVPDAGP